MHSLPFPPTSIPALPAADVQGQEREPVQGLFPDFKQQAAMNAMPLYRQVHQRFIRAIAEGTLVSSQRVPSIRALASELQISRNTVEQAYQLLISEGYLETRGQAGTVVSAQSLALRARPVAPQEPPPSPVLSLYDGASGIKPERYQLGLPALDLFPRKLWNRLNARQLRLQNQYLSYPQPAGYAALRDAIASYLRISRGLHCSAQQVFINAGYRGALNLICRTLLNPLDQIWIEDPCFPPSRHLLAGMGAQLVPVPVDQDGMCVDIGVERAPRARFALVTPAHQSPLGVSLSLPRRRALIEWANRNNSFIIEDDYDSEYRYDGRAEPAMASLGEHNNVLYVGTFSKVLSPALRLAYVVVPQQLAPQFNASCHTWNDGCPLLNQGVVADFMQEGHFMRHLRKMRIAYAERRQMAMDGLLAAFGDRMRFNVPASGLHLLARLDRSEDDIAMVARAKQRNFGIGALSARAMEANCGKGLLLGFANVASPEQAAAQAIELRRCVDP